MSMFKPTKVTSNEEYYEFRIDMAGTCYDTGLLMIKVQCLRHGFLIRPEQEGELPAIATRNALSILLDRGPHNYQSDTDFTGAYGRIRIPKVEINRIYQLAKAEKL